MDTSYYFISNIQHLSSLLHRLLHPGSSSPFLSPLLPVLLPWHTLSSSFSMSLFIRKYKILPRTLYRIQPKMPVVLREFAVQQKQGKAFFDVRAHSGMVLPTGALGGSLRGGREMERWFLRSFSLEILQLVMCTLAPTACRWDNIIQRCALCWRTSKVCLFRFSWSFFSHKPLNATSFPRGPSCLLA